MEQMATPTERASRALSMPQAPIMQGAALLLSASKFTHWQWCMSYCWAQPMAMAAEWMQGVFLRRGRSVREREQKKTRGQRESNALTAQEGSEVATGHAEVLSFMS